MHGPTICSIRALVPSRWDSLQEQRTGTWRWHTWRYFMGWWWRTSQRTISGCSAHWCQCGPACPQAEGFDQVLWTPSWGTPYGLTAFCPLRQNYSVFLICKMGIVTVPFLLGLLQVLNKIVHIKPQTQCQAMVTVHFLVAVVDMSQAGVSMAGFWNLLLEISLQYVESWGQIRVSKYISHHALRRTSPLACIHTPAHTGTPL